MGKLKRGITFALFAYLLAGVAAGTVFWLSAPVGVSRVKGLRNLFRRTRRGTLIVANHPSMLETILLGFMFLPIYLFCPWKVPYILGDKKKVGAWWAFLFRSRLLSVDRDGGDNSESWNRAVQILLSGGIVIIFPEGGRTFKGTSFHYSEKKGKKIRPLKYGFTELVKLSGAQVLPIWFERQWVRVRITVGKPMEFSVFTRREVMIEKVEKAILDLGDQTG